MKGGYGLDMASVNKNLTSFHASKARGSRFAALTVFGEVGTLSGR